MLNTVLKQPKQLLHDAATADQQALHQQFAISWHAFYQTQQQLAHLAGLQFRCSLAANRRHWGWQAQPELQLQNNVQMVYRQFIRLQLGKGHMILAETVQVNTISLTAVAGPINCSFWIHVRSGVIQ